jgi:dihydropteroate synthase
LDVYDFLDDQINRLNGQGIARNCIIADPGIGFGKTMAHNLALLNKISLFHSLGVPLLLGVSRKGFIGKITQENVAEGRVIGSVSAALTGVSQGVQIFRVHDVRETRQAFDMWQTIMFGIK